MGTVQVKTYLDMVWRRKWWVIVPLIASAGIGAYLWQTLPRLYRTQTTILVLPQRIPESFVQSTVTSQARESLNSLRVQVMSDKYLGQVVEEFGLVPEGAPPGDIERASRQLSRRVQLEYDRRRFTYFRIYTIDEQPERAAGIADRLAGMFIESNRRLREGQATGTREYMDERLALKKAELDRLEAEIATFDRRHYFELPAREGGNQARLNQLQQSLGTTTTEIQSLEQRVAFQRSQLRTIDALVPGEGPADESKALVQQLVQMQDELAQLLTRYQPEHPSVRRKQTEISEFKRQHADVLPEDLDTKGMSSEEVAVRDEIAQLESQIAFLKQRRSEIAQEIETVTRRIETTPLRAQERSLLTRDYDLLKAEYNDLQMKRERAEEGENFETSGQAQQFEIQDRARVPTSPYSPNLPFVVGACLLAGLAFGAGVVFLLELLDNTVRTEIEFERAFPDVPILVAIPRLDVGGSKPGPAKRGDKHAAA